jgi:hypothetical protein
MTQVKKCTLAGRETGFTPGYQRTVGLMFFGV